MTQNRDIDSRLDLLVATIEQARSLAHNGESEAALVTLAVDLADQSARAQRQLAARSSRAQIAALLGITPQGVSKRYPGAFSN